MVNYEPTTQSEPTQSAGSAGNRQRDPYGQWLDAVTAGAMYQTNMLMALNRAALQTGLSLQRHNAALAGSWMRAMTGTAGTGGTAARSPSEPTRQTAAGGPPGGDHEAESMSRVASQIRENATGPAPSTQQTRPQEQPLEPALESKGGQIAAERSRPESRSVDPGSDVNRLDSIGPRAAQQLRSADVHTIEQLANARTKELAAETGIHPRRIRVWVFRARRMGAW